MSDYIRKSALFNLFKDLADKHETQFISYNALNEVILQQPTVDEKEIIRKTMERIFKRLKASSYREEPNDCDPFGDVPHYVVSLLAIKQILKEECEISE